MFKPLCGAIIFGACFESQHGFLTLQGHRVRIHPIFNDLNGFLTTFRSRAFHQTIDWTWLSKSTKPIDKRNLKFRIFGSSREWNYISDILHPRNKLYGPFKSEPES